MNVLTYASKCDTNINKVVERVVRYDLLLCSNLPPTDDKCLFSSHLHTHTILKRGPQTASDGSSSNVKGKFSCLGSIKFCWNIKWKLYICKYS